MRKSPGARFRSCLSSASFLGLIHEISSSHLAPEYRFRQYEIDFVVNLADERIYIQSAYAIPDSEKRAQETFSLRHVNDNFRKVVITGNLHEKPWRDENGITFIGIMPFLLDPHSLETL